MTPQELSRELRHGDGRWLTNRRRIVLLSCTAAECMQLVGLYQMGLIRHLPDPPLPGFNSDRVDASEEAYAKLSMPDAFLGLASYATTAGLAVAGGRDRVSDRPSIPALMGAKAVVDAIQAGKLSWDQWSKHRAFCIWCLIAAGATFATVRLAMPEALAGLKRLTGRVIARFGR